MKRTYKSLGMRWAFVAGLAALLVGCAGANLMSKAVTAGEFQLTSARMRWDETAAFQLQFYGQKYSTPTSAEVQSAQDYVAPLMRAFREKGSERIGAVLAANGVPTGDAFTIVISPQRVIRTSTGARNMVMDIVVLDRSGVRARMVMNAVGTSSIESGVVLDSFANKLVAEFVSAGWMPRK